MLNELLRVTAIGVLLLSATTGAGAQKIVPDDGEVVETVEPEPPIASPYGFSDELGGFAIQSVTGIGTRADPVHIVQTANTATPVTMVVQAVRPINPFGAPGPYATGNIHIVLDIINVSGIPWIGLELELQEHYTKASIYGDGLSFDQRRQEDGGALSSAFANARHTFEPYDRLLFEQGALDHSARAQFRFLVTDLTPTPVFYIRLDPRIPAS